MPMPVGDGVNITVKLPRDMATRGTFGDGTDDGLRRFSLCSEIN